MTEVLQMSADFNCVEKVSIEVLNPKGALASPKVEGLHAPRPADLNGKRIALLSERPDAVVFFKAVGALLKARFPDCSLVSFPSYCNPLIGDNTQEVAANCDVWLQGVKTATNSWFDGDVTMEKLGKPGVSFSVDSLCAQKTAVAEANGIGAIRLISVPSLAYSKAKANPALMEDLAASLIDEIVEALTSPLTEAEINPPQPEYDDSPVTFTGDSYDEVLEQYQDYCIQNKLCDGFPVIPPTRKRVDEMLRGTSYAPDKEIGIVMPRGGIATVEKIAINAVMAGAKPEYLPVIIAMLECISDRDFNQFHISAGILPVYWISGPIIEELGMNNDINYLGPGNKVNNTIARAVALCQINIGWRDLSVYGSPGGTGKADNFTNYLIPENLRYGPWEESYAVSRGYEAEESIVSACEFLEMHYGLRETHTASFDAALRAIAKVFDVNKVDLYGSVGGKAPGTDAPRYIVVLHPTFAHQIAEQGLDRRSFVQKIYDMTAINWDKMSEEARAKFRQEVIDGKWGRLREADCKPGLLLEPFNDLDNVAVLVSGNWCGRTAVYKTSCGSTAWMAERPADFVPRPYMTKVIHGATMTEAGK